MPFVALALISISRSVRTGLYICLVFWFYWKIYFSDFNNLSFKVIGFYNKTPFYFEITIYILEKDFFIPCILIMYIALHQIFPVHPYIPKHPNSHSWFLSLVIIKRFKYSNKDSKYRIIWRKIEPNKPEWNKQNHWKKRAKGKVHETHRFKDIHIYNTEINIKPQNWKIQYICKCHTII